MTFVTIEGGTYTTKNTIPPKNSKVISPPSFATNAAQTITQIDNDAQGFSAVALIPPAEPQVDRVNWKALAVTAADWSRDTSDQWVETEFTKTGIKFHLLPVRAATALINYFHARWLWDEVMIYDYEVGHYIPGKSVIDTFFLHAMDAVNGQWGSAEARKVQDVIAVLTKARDGEQSPEHWARVWDSRPEITFENGVLDLHDLSAPQLLPFDSTHYATFHISTRWNPEAHSDTLDHFLESSIPDANSRENLLAFIGYAMARYDLRFQHFVYLLGAGRNGKSVVLKLVRQLFAEYYSTTPLGKITTNRFAAAGLIRKAINVVGDQDATFLGNTETIKQLTGFDAVESERKFRDAHPAVAKTKMIFAVNSLPPTRDNTVGFFRRPVIVEFPVIFTAETSDRTLEHKLLDNPEVVEYLAIKCVTAYAQAVHRGSFHLDGRTGEILTEYRKDNDIVFAAVQDGLLVADPKQVRCVEPWAVKPLMDLYSDERGQEHLSAPTIKQRLNGAGFRLTISQVREGGKRARKMFGLKVDENEARDLVERAAMPDKISGLKMLKLGRDKYVSVEDFLRALGVGMEDLPF